MKVKYHKQVELLLDLIPTIALDKDFALKGGTAINLFIMDMPRLSVDLDLVYLPLNDEKEVLQNISFKSGILAPSYVMRMNIGKRK